MQESGSRVGQRAKKPAENAPEYPLDAFGLGRHRRPMMREAQSRFSPSRAVPLRVSVILAHPSLRSFNAAIAQTAVATLKRNSHRVIFHDLYRERFDPVLPALEIKKGAHLPPGIQRHCAEIRNADGLVIIHPNWWGEPPAILKGWVDRVLRVGVAYDFPPGPQGAAGLPIELLHNIKTVLVLNTSDTPAQREAKVLRDPLQTIWKNTLRFCGIRDFRRKMYRVVVISTPAQRASWLGDVRARITRAFPRSPSVR